jgi:hypothetical protein
MIHPKEPDVRAWNVRTYVMWHFDISTKKSHGRNKSVLEILTENHEKNGITVKLIFKTDLFPSWDKSRCNRSVISTFLPHTLHGIYVRTLNVHGDKLSSPRGMQYRFTENHENNEETLMFNIPVSSFFSLFAVKRYSIPR